MAVELPKLERMFVPIDSGKITTAIQKDQNSLSDQTKMWRTDVFVNHLVRVTDPSGRREIELVAGNAGSTIVIRDTWMLSFPAGSDYEILAVNLIQALRDVFGGGADISATNPLQVYDPKKLTTFGQETVGATGSNGTNWVDLLDRTTITKPTEIWGYILTIAGGWAGLCQMRIVDGSGNKIYPFGDYDEENTDFISGIEHMFPAPVVVPVSSGYKVQFRSSNGGDGAGQTCALTELDIIERG